MTKAKINSREDLTKEIRRLTAACDQNEKKLHADLSSLTDELNPNRLIINILSSITGIRIAKDEFLRNGLFIGLGLLAQKFLFKKEMHLERKIYSWMDGVFEKIRHYTHKFSGAGADRIEEED